MRNLLLKTALPVMLLAVYFLITGSFSKTEKEYKPEFNKQEPTQVSYLPSFKDEFVNIIFNKGYTWDNNFVPFRLDRMRDSLHFNGSQNYFWQDSYYGNIL